MATAAFKSTTKRISSDNNNANNNDNNSNNDNYRNSLKSDRGRIVGHRRSRSLSHFGRYPSEISSTVSSVLRQIDIHNKIGNEKNNGRNNTDVGNGCGSSNPGPFVNTLRGSADRQSDGRRGRSVTRNGSVTGVPARDVSNARRRQRSVSVVRNQPSDSSESDLDPAFNRTVYHRLSDINSIDGQKHVSEKLSRDDVFKPQRGGLRRCSSQMDLSRCHDDHSSFGSSSLTDDEGSDMTHSDHGDEKTIRAVYAQMKSLRSDHPTREMDAVDLLEAMRSEVRHAIAELRSELRQADRKNNSLSTDPKGDLSEPKSTGVKKHYTAKLEQSEKRARDLRTKLAVEELRNQELAKILEDIVSGSKSAQIQKPSRRRRNSADRKQMSKSLNEEAQKYIDEFLSMSNIEDSEFSSSFEDDQLKPDNGRKTQENGTYQEILLHNSDIENTKCLHGTQHAPPCIENDGVVLPWLQWETTPDCHPQFSKADLEAVIIDKNYKQKPQFGNEDLEAVTSEKNAQQRFSEEVGSNDSNTIFYSKIPTATSSNYSSGSWTPGNNYQLNIFELDSSAAVSPNLSSTQTCGESKVEKGRNKLKDYVRSEHDYVRFPTYQDDEYILHANNEALLVENMKLENRNGFGGVILCRTGLF